MPTSVFSFFFNFSFEVFAESSSLMLLEFESLIQHSPCVFSSMRLLQLMVINMFSIDNTALKGLPHIAVGIFI